MTQVVDHRYAFAKQRRTEEADRNLQQQFGAAFGEARAAELLDIAKAEPDAMRPAARTTSTQERLARR